MLLCWTVRGDASLLAKHRRSSGCSHDGRRAYSCRAQTERRTARQKRLPSCEWRWSRAKTPTLRAVRRKHGTHAGDGTEQLLDEALPTRANMQTDGAPGICCALAGT